MAARDPVKRFRIGDVVAGALGAFPCWRKVPYESAAAADAEMQRVARSTSARNVARLSVYRCRHCKQFHFGHDVPEKTT